MTKEPQPTTHNAERGARGTCRERSEAGFSPKRTEKKVGCSLIGEISLKVYSELFGGLEKNMWRDTLAIWRRRVWRKIIWHFLAKNVSVFWRKRLAFFGENRSEILEIWRTLLGKIVVGDLEKSFGDFGENHSATLEIWRTLFGKIMVGDLEKSFGDFGENVLEKKPFGDFWRLLWSIVMLGNHTRRSKVKGEKMETNYGDQNFIHHKMESIYLERFKGRNV